MTKRYRLTARAQFHGEVRDPGYVFTLAEGELGPHKTVPKGAEDTQIADHIGGGNGLVDMPLYVECSDEQNAGLDEAEKIKIDEADRAAEETAAHTAKGDAPVPERQPAAEPKQVEDHSAAGDPFLSTASHDAGQVS